MGYDGTDNVTSGEETKEEHYDQLLNNMIALASVPRLHTFSSVFSNVYDTDVWTDASEDKIEIVGDNLQGFTCQFIFMCKLASGEARARIYSVFMSSVLVGSTVSFSNTSPDRKESIRLFFPRGTSVLKLQIKTSTESDHARVWDAAVRIGG